MVRVLALSAVDHGFVP